MSQAKIIPLNDYVVIASLNKETTKEGMFYSSGGASIIKVGKVINDPDAKLQGKEVYFKSEDAEVLQIEASEFYLVSKTKLLAYINE